LGAAIFNGTAVKILKNILRYKDGTELPAATIPTIVTHASASTNNAVARFDLATGKIIQNSVVIIDDTGNTSGLGTLNTHTLPAGTDTIALLAATQTLSNKTLTLPEINDTSSDHTYIFAVSELAANRTITLPLLTTNDTFVFEDHTQTLINKTLTTPLITTNGTIDTTGAGTLAIGSSMGANNLTLGSATGNTQIANTLTLNADGVGSLEAVTKQQLDAALDGVQRKRSCVMATTANITLSGEQTIDGVLTSTSRVLVKDQTALDENGMYLRRKLEAK